MMRTALLGLVAPAALGCGFTLRAPPDAGAPGVGGPHDPPWPEPAALPPELDFPPYLTLPDPTTVVVSWRTTAETTGVVRFGTTPAYGTERAAATPAHLHQVALADLEPATAHYYEVAIDGTDVTRAGVFVTPGAPRWRFVHFGEFHAPSFSPVVTLYAEQIRAFRPHVLVESGDMADDGDKLEHWRDYLRASAPWIGNVLLLPAHSNHTNGPGGNVHARDLFVLPHNERWYATRYGQVEILTLDSTFDSANSDVKTDQLTWLAARAAEAHDGVDDPALLLAAWHYPACSSHYASRANERVWVQDNFVQILRTAGGVDLILAAHDKYYERAALPGGIVHLMTNIGNLSPETPGGDHPDCTTVKTVRDNRSTALVTVDGTTLAASIVDPSGVELDAFAIAK